jgi:hypothetical protein
LGTLVGLFSAAVLRILDYYLPKGRMSRFTARHSVPVESAKDEEEQAG